MAICKLIILALLCQTPCTSAAEESCASTSEDQEGRALLQVSDSSLATPKKHSPREKGHSHPAQKKSKGKGKLAKVKKAKTPDASNVALSESGYKTIASMCCSYEMEEFIRRVVGNENMKVCDEGGLQGMVPWHACEAKQNFTVLMQEINEASTGLCPFVASKGEECKKVTKSCGVSVDPMSHRRRNCGRNDVSQNLDLVMQNAATNEFVDSWCGVHQQYSDVIATAGILKTCSIGGNIKGNQTAMKLCLKECCKTDGCIGIATSSLGTTLQSGFADALVAEGTIAYLHRQR